VRWTLDDADDGHGGLTLVRGRREGREKAKPAAFPAASASVIWDSEPECGFERIRSERGRLCDP